jgi:hypothetical protein
LEKYVRRLHEDRPVLAMTMQIPICFVAMKKSPGKARFTLQFLSLLY